jgi:hypothetical protein
METEQSKTDYFRLMFLSGIALALLAFLALGCAFSR